jgi:C-terminal processing protease CtpA/Prc
MTSLRGHFVDGVATDTKAEKAGMGAGDMIVDVNGKVARDMTHQTLVDYMKAMADSGGEIKMILAKVPVTEMV